MKDRREARGFIAGGGGGSSPSMLEHARPTHGSGVAAVESGRVPAADKVTARDKGPPRASVLKSHIRCEIQRTSSHGAISYVGFWKDRPFSDSHRLPGCSLCFCCCGGGMKGAWPTESTASRLLRSDIRGIRTDLFLHFVGRTIPPRPVRPSEIHEAQP